MELLTIEKTKRDSVVRIPVFTYEVFYDKVVACLQRDPSNRIMNYYGKKENGTLWLFFAIAGDKSGTIQLGSYSLVHEPGILLASLSRVMPEAYHFESAITKKLGIHFTLFPRKNKKVLLASPKEFAVLALRPMPLN